MNAIRAEAYDTTRFTEENIVDFPMIFGNEQFISSSTFTPMISATPSSTLTPTPTNTATPTSTPTPTSTATPTSTPTPTNTTTSTSTPTPTNTEIPEDRIAVLALNDDTACDTLAKKGVTFSGSELLSFGEGSIYSNGCLECINPLASVQILNGSIQYAGGMRGCTEIDINPAPVYTPDLISADYFGVTKPDCSGLPGMGSFSGSGTIFPGIYGSIFAYDILFMEPGLYCVVGNFRVDHVYGNDVTIYMLVGDFRVYQSIHLTAPETAQEASDGVVDVLLYMDELTDTAEYGVIYASADSFAIGTIFAPTSDFKIIAALSQPMLNLQLIAWNVEFGGVYPLDINMIPSRSYPK